MRNLLIGSRALSYWFPEMKIKDSADFDVICNKPPELSGNNIEYFVKKDSRVTTHISTEAKIEWHDRWLLNNSELGSYTTDSAFIEIQGIRYHVVAPIGLAIIKRSHLWRDLKWNKHITHYHKYLKEFEQYYTDYDRSLLTERTAMTMQRYPQGNPNLMQSKEDFFDDAVEKLYDHDYLHELYAHYDKPLYTKLLRQADLAWCEESKWQMLSHEDKLKCIQEEVYVIATERYLVRNNWKYPAKRAYMQALQKVCTTLCSGWFRDYSIDYYPELVHAFDESKVQKIKLVLTHEKGV